MLSLERQAAFVAEMPELFLSISGGWGRRGCTHIRLAQADATVLAGALHAAGQTRMDKNLAAQRRRRS